jgi:hypothetical protein
MNTKNKCQSIAVAVLAAMLVATTALASAEDAFAGKKKKEYNQATSQANTCGNDELPS